MMSHTLKANLFIVCIVFLRLSGVVFANEIKGRCERYHLPDDGLCAASVTYPGESIRISSFFPVKPHEDPYFLLAYMIGVDESDPNYQSMEDKEVTKCTRVGGRRGKGLGRGCVLCHGGMMPNEAQCNTRVRSIMSLPTPSFSCPSSLHFESCSLAFV
jgi:hypothetical protein